MKVKIDILPLEEDSTGNGNGDSDIQGDNVLCLIILIAAIIGVASLIVLWQVINRKKERKAVWKLKNFQSQDFLIFYGKNEQILVMENLLNWTR